MSSLPTPQRGVSQPSCDFEAGGGERHVQSLYTRILMSSSPLCRMSLKHSPVLSAELTAAAHDEKGPGEH